MRCDVDAAAGQTVKRAGGTRCYLAPEAIMQQPVGAPCDWWALGVLVFELLVGHAPFLGENDKALNQAICNARVRFPRDVDGKGECKRPAHGDGDATRARADPHSHPTRARTCRHDAGGEMEGEEDTASAASPISSDAVSFVRKLLSKKLKEKPFDAAVTTLTPALTRCASCSKA